MRSESLIVVVILLHLVVQITKRLALLIKAVSSNTQPKNIDQEAQTRTVHPEKQLRHPANNCQARVAEER